MALQTQLADSPLLQSAQDALQRQLEGVKSTLGAEIRERNKALQDAKVRREDLGVELFGYQQQLRGIFKALEESKERDVQLALLREAATAKLKEKEEELKAAELLAKERASQVDAGQADLEKLATTLRQMEQHYGDMRGKVAVTKRETFATEEALQAWERDKLQQDTLVLHLNRRIDAHRRRIQRLQAQASREAARKAATEAATAEQMATAEKLQAEIKTLLGRWREAVSTVQKNDEEHQKLSGHATFIADESRALTSEMAGIARETAAVSASHAKLAEYLARVQQDSKALALRTDAVSAERQELEGETKQLQQEAETARAQLSSAKADLKAAEAQKQLAQKELEIQAGRTQAKKAAMMGELQNKALEKRELQQQMQELQKLEAAADKKEAAVAAARKELDKLLAKKDRLAEQNSTQAEQLKQLEEEAAVAGKLLSEAEVAEKQRADQIERYSRDVAAANRKLEKLIADAGPEAHSGPLEATIAHLKQELATQRESNSLTQRQWINAQRELLRLQAAAHAEAERENKLRTKQAILKQRCNRLTDRQQQTEIHIKSLEKDKAQQLACLAQYDGQIAADNAAHVALSESALTSRRKAEERLKEEEEAVETLKEKLDAAKQEKATCLQRLLDIESEVAEWQSKLQQSSDKASSSSTASAEQILAARQQLHKLQCQEAGLRSAQQKLMKDIERAIDKREVIATKGRAISQRHTLTPSQLSESAGRRRIAAELKRALQKTTSKSAEVSGEIERLTAAKAAAEAERTELERRWRELDTARANAAAEVEELEHGKVELLFRTSNAQRKAGLAAKLANGELRLPVAAAALDDSLSNALEDRAKLMKFLQEATNEELKPAFQRLYSECAAADC